METIFIKGNSADFVVFIQGLGDKAELRGIDGKFRWVVTRDDGTEYVARPEESNPEANA
jgi:hypothetical protein